MCVQQQQHGKHFQPLNSKLRIYSQSMVLHSCSYFMYVLRTTYIVYRAPQTQCISIYILIFPFFPREIHLLFSFSLTSLAAQIIPNKFSSASYSPLSSFFFLLSLDVLIQSPIYSVFFSSSFLLIHTASLSIEA